MTSIINNIFGLEGMEITAISEEGEQIQVEGEMLRESIECPRCGHKTGVYRDKKVRRFHLPPYGSKKCYLNATLHRIGCHCCGHIYSPILPFMSGKRRMSRTFINYALELLKFGTIQDVADHLGVGWDCIKEIHVEELEEKYEDIPLEDIEYLGIDEFSIRKRHKYMTVISNIRTGRIVYVVEGRKQEDIELFLQKLKKKPRNCALSAWTSVNPMLQP